MTSADAFISWLLNTERDLGVHIQSRYEKYKKTLPTPQMHDGELTIDGRYSIYGLNGDIALRYIEGETSSLIAIYQRPSSVIVDLIGHSIRQTHPRASVEDATAEILRLTEVCRQAFQK
ncbi:hypothetical protein [Citrobacter sp. TSA-1]|uniref:hypothetical protein n=1 Tax=Citrobacter sp. TSA-1 TaxID=184912 RepID=UPI000BAE4F53|nr:hypothetical protein [Citrobacter sp. TSA-1]PAX78140.1 hypothetical protein CIK43_19105 [Citrobacter sp. TSA-1]QKE19515.1 hypothetical protein HF677_007465 [Citrobacter sp. TSA-1]